MNKALIALLIGLPLAACAAGKGPAPSGVATAAAPSSGKLPANKNGQLEPLYGIALVAGGLRLRVRSNGCTSAEDFRLDLAPGGTATRLSVRRLKPDGCRAMPRPLEIELPLTLDGPLLLDNPLHMPNVVLRQG